MELTRYIWVIVAFTFDYSSSQQTTAVFMSDDVTYSCGGYVDLVLVVESSAFTRYITPLGIPIWHPGIHNFIDNLIKVLHISPTSFRVAIVLYSTGIDDIMTFSVHQLYALHTSGYLIPGYGSTSAAKGLLEMRRMLTYYGRPGAARRAVLISASLSDDPQATLAEANLARTMGIDIVSVGFGPFRNIDELSRISPGWVLEVADAGMLYALVGRVAARLCKAAVTGGWSAWQSWTPCSKSCDGGITRRYRFCNSPFPQFGGSFCAGPPEIVAECNTGPCLSFFSTGVDWSSWQACSVTCGAGTRSRSRPCVGRTQVNWNCNQRGSEVQTSTCNEPACSDTIEPTWSDWLPWEPCSVTCGKGVRLRRRTCQNSSTQQKRKCLGPGMDSEICDNKIACKECETCSNLPGSRRYVGCPHDCSIYVQCSTSGYKSLLKTCPYGFLWSNTWQKCVDPANCECDPCSGAPSGSAVSYSRSCKAYWVCQDVGPAILHCCAAGYMFVPNLGCMRDVDNSCKMSCYSSRSLDFTKTNCTNRASVLGPYWFEEVADKGRKTRACPLGTQFSPSVCQCVMSSETLADTSLTKGCHTMVKMAFESEHQDIESTPSKIRFKNVLYINNEKALFRQNSSTRFWYFSNNDWGNKVFIHLRILPEMKSPPQAILHNGGCESYSKPSLLIAMDSTAEQNKLMYSFGLTIEETNEMVFINLTSKRTSDYSDLALRFDGFVFEAEVNGKTSEMRIPNKGKIARRRGALQLGGKACSIGFNAFSGLADVLEVTSCGDE